MLTDIRDRCNAIEECYEFMLSYAAKGLPGDDGRGTGGELRHHLNRASEALSGLAETYAKEVKERGLQPAERYRAFIGVLDRDAHDAATAIELVRALPSISSQVIDNLNALIHLRALLTDLFLIDEILRPQPAPANQAPSQF